MAVPSPSGFMGWKNEKNQRIMLAKKGREENKLSGGSGREAGDRLRND
jgi:hypothetical protein